MENSPNPFRRASRLQRTPPSGASSGKQTTLKEHDITKKPPSDKRPHESSDEEQEHPLKKPNTVSSDSESEKGVEDEVFEVMDTQKSPITTESSSTYDKAKELINGLLKIGRFCHKYGKISAEKSSNMLDKVDELSQILNSMHMSEQIALARVDERSKILSTLRQPEMSQISYASIVKNPTPGVAIPPETKKQASQSRTILVFPKNDKLTSEDVRDHIKSKINPKSDNVRIKRMSRIRNGGVALEVPDTSDEEKLRDKLEPDLTLKKPAKRQPKAIIYGVDKEITQEELIEGIYQQNYKDSPEDQFRKDVVPKFKTGPRLNDQQNWVLECSPAYFKTFVARGSLYLGWKSLKVTEFFSITRCYRCQRYGHLARDCKSREVCGHCSGEGHERDNCPKIRLNPVCANCPKGKKDHSVHDKAACSSYQKELLRIKEITDYGP